MKQPSTRAAVGLLLPGLDCGGDVVVAEAAFKPRLPASAGAVFKLPLPPDAEAAFKLRLITLRLVEGTK